MFGPSANLSLLAMENNYLSMGQKTIQELHYHFGHLGLEQVQFIFHHFPFSTQTLSHRTKHIGLPYHWIRSKVSSLEIDIVIQAVFSADQLADQFTKGLVKKRFIVQQS